MLKISLPCEVTAKQGAGAGPQPQVKRAPRLKFMNLSSGNLAPESRRLTKVSNESSESESLCDRRGKKMMKERRNLEEKKKLI